MKDDNKTAIDHRFSTDGSITLSTKQLFPDRSNTCSDYNGDQINERNRNPQSNGTSNSQFRVSLEEQDGSGGRRKRSIQEMNGHSNDSPFHNQSRKRPKSDHNNCGGSAAIISAQLNLAVDKAVDRHPHQKSNNDNDDFPVSVNNMVGCHGLLGHISPQV